jgi:DNA-binding CsgD family transcriptional regulator
MGSRLIGRDNEVSALRGTLERTVHGASQIALISGEAGIGKSRLAAEIVAIATAQGLTTLDGRAHPLHAGLAYAPIIEALRPHLTDGTSAFTLHSPAHEPALAKARMFGTIANRINEIAPALLFIDDLHWADQGTVELAHYVSHNTEGVLVLVTCREPTGPLRDLAVAIRREDPRNEIALQPLAEPAVAELATDVLGDAPSAALLKDLTQRAQGNPLFITALAHAPLDPATLPTIVRDVVLTRLHGLDERARRLVEIVSVAGDAGSDDLLRTIWHADDFEPVLRGLVRGGLVTEHVTNRTIVYRIAHPLYAEVAYAELTAHERRLVHATIIRAIDDTRPDDVLTLAPHYLGAGDLVDPGRTAQVLATAGWRALEIHAEDEAIRYLTAALADAHDPDLVIRLLDGLGRVHQGAGRLAEASEHWNEAIAVALQENQPERLGPLAYWLALLEAERGNFEAVLRHVHTADQAGRPADPERAAEYIVLRMHFGVRGNDKDQIRLGSDELIAEGGPAAHLGRSTLATLDSDWNTARQQAEAVLAHQGRFGGRLWSMLMAVARSQLVLVSVLEGDLVAARRHAEANRDARPVFEYSMFASAAHYYVSFTRYLTADIHGALSEIDKGVTLERQSARPRMLAWTLMFRAWVLIELGRLSDGEADLLEAERHYGMGIRGEVGLAMLNASAWSLLHMYNGQPERAPDLPDYADSLHDPIAAGFWLLIAGEAAIATGDETRSAHIAVRLRDAGKTAPLVDALADRLTGQINDPTLLLSAADRLASMGAAGLAAQTRLIWAERQQDPAPIPDCLAAFEHSGMAHWSTQARSLAKTLGLRLLSKKTDGLSKRETQVVTLLGDGLSNAEIAARLFVSERTVESHLRNSYAKLGLTSRLALARWASEHAT